MDADQGQQQQIRDREMIARVKVGGKKASSGEDASALVHSAPASSDEGHYETTSAAKKVVILCYAKNIIKGTIVPNYLRS